MICFRCKKPIGKMEHRFEFIEINDDKTIRIDDCHKTCWDEFKKGVTDVTRAKGLLGRLEKGLINQGVIEPEVIEI